MKNTLFLAGVVGLAITVAGCGGKEVVRGSQEPGVDSAALSTGIDKDDIQRMLKENLDNLRSAPVMNGWRTTNPKPKIAVFPFVNKTTEHIDGQLDTILSEAETWLIDAQVVDVVAHDRQAELINDVKNQHTDAFDPNTVARYGKQLGVQYALTGKVQDNAERSEDMRRVQYFFFMQVIEVETGVIKWQHKAYVTKAIK